jgi:hypothetical protein
MVMFPRVTIDSFSSDFYSSLHFRCSGNKCSFVKQSRDIFVPTRRWTEDELKPKRMTSRHQSNEKGNSQGKEQ